MTVARNYVLSGLTEQDVSNNFQVYDPAAKSKPLGLPPLSKLPTWAVERIKGDEKLHWFDPVQVSKRKLWQSIMIIVEWFNSFPNKDTRLNRLDRINFETAAYGAARWSNSISGNIWDYVKDKPPVVTRYENGFFWVKLITQLHFEREGNLQKHCVGGFGYFNSFKTKASEFFSLRDRDNKPHVTLEVSLQPAPAGGVIQCKGNSNAKPKAEYQRYIMPFINKMGWRVVGDARMIDGA